MIEECYGIDTSRVALHFRATPRERYHYVVQHLYGRLRQGDIVSVFVYAVTKQLPVFLKGTRGALSQVLLRPYFLLGSMSEHGLGLCSALGGLCCLVVQGVVPGVGSSCCAAKKTVSVL